MPWICCTCGTSNKTSGHDNDKCTKCKHVICYQCGFGASAHAQVAHTYSHHAPVKSIDALKRNLDGCGAN